MANYLNQLDPSGFCCNCPDRTSPCDDCGPPPNSCSCVPGFINCPSEICFSVKLDSNDDSDGDFFDLQSGTNTLLGIFHYIPGNEWEIYNIYNGLVTIPAVNPYGTWHCFTVNITSDSNTGKVNASIAVDGGTPVTLVVLDPSLSHDSLFFVDNIEFGNQYQTTGTAAHRSIGAINALSRDPCSLLVPGAFNFSFPPGPFDSFTGTAQVNGNVLRIDQSVIADAYGKKLISNSYYVSCCGAFPNHVLNVNVTSYNVTASGTCPQGQVLSAITPITYVGVLGLDSQTDEGGSNVLVCGGIKSNINAGNFRYTCGGNTNSVTPTGLLSFQIHRALCQGNIGDRNVNYGDWLFRSPDYSWDDSNLGNCSACMGTFTGSTAQPAYIGVLNTYQFTTGGITTTFNLNFTVT